MLNEFGFSAVWTIGIIVTRPGLSHRLGKCCAVDSDFIFIPHHTLVAGYYGITLVVGVPIRLSVRLWYVRPSWFSLPDDFLSICQLIFTKLGMCIDIVVI